MSTDPQDLEDAVTAEMDPAACAPFLAHPYHNQLTTICVYNKGGVLKSTMTAELGFMLSDMGISVLLVDLDSQCCLTENLLRVQEPVDEMEVAGRVVYHGHPLDRRNEHNRPIYYSVYEGLSWHHDLGLRPSPTTSSPWS